nr:hypothetical protein HGMM_F29E04C16 [Candidatus Caldarchaeum subterraneum]
MLARVLAVIRSRGKASLDDIIIISGLPIYSVHNAVNELVARGIIYVKEEDGKIFYTVSK